jgi:hypothetical protein
MASKVRRVKTKNFWMQSCKKKPRIWGPRLYQLHTRHGPSLRHVRNRGSFFHVWQVGSVGSWQREVTKSLKPCPVTVPSVLHWFYILHWCWPHLL